jgi:hypothetical protein
VALHQGDVRSIHKVTSAKKRPGPKSRGRSEFETACIAFTDCLYAQRQRDGHHPTHSEIDAEARVFIAPAAKHLGVLIAESTLAEWRRDTPPREQIGPNRLFEGAAQRDRMTMLTRLREQGSLDLCIDALRAFFSMDNFCHLEPFASTLEERKRKNREYQARYRERQRRRKG